MKTCWSLSVGCPYTNYAAFSSQLWFILPIKATAKKQNRRTRSCELIRGSIVSSVGSLSAPDVPVVQKSRSIAGVTSHAIEESQSLLKERPISNFWYNSPLLAKSEVTWLLKSSKWLYQHRWCSYSGVHHANRQNLSHLSHAGIWMLKR